MIGASKRLTPRCITRSPCPAFNHHPRIYPGWFLSLHSRFQNSTDELLRLFSVYLSSHDNEVHPIANSKNPISSHPRTRHFNAPHPLNRRRSGPSPSSPLCPSPFSSNPFHALTHCRPKISPRPCREPLARCTVYRDPEISPAPDVLSGRGAEGVWACRRAAVGTWANHAPGNRMGRMCRLW